MLSIEQYRLTSYQIYFYTPRFDRPMTTMMIITTIVPPIAPIKSIGSIWTGVPPPPPDVVVVPVSVVPVGVVLVVVVSVVVDVVVVVVVVVVDGFHVIVKGVRVAVFALLSVA